MKPKLFACAAVICLLLPASFEAQKNGTQTNSAMVKLRVTVVDAQSGLVDNLPKESFTVYEGSTKQTIESFSFELGNLSCGFLVDTSGSMRPYMELVKRIVLALLKVIGNKDESCLVSFKAEPELIQDFTSDKVEIEKAVDEMYSSGGSSLFDAIVATSDHLLKKGKNQRKALVIITDSMESNSGFDLKKTMKAVEENNVPIYILTLPYLSEDRRSKAKKLGKAEEAVIRLADISGGEAFFSESLARLDSDIQKVGAAIQARYLINYISANKTRKGQFQELRIEVRDKNSVLLTPIVREGYFAFK